METKDENIRRNFIIDEEIDLFEKQTNGDVQKKDLLNTLTYVNILTNCVINAPEDKAFTIGLFGEWGSGKSSIIKTFSNEIVSKYKEQKKDVQVITYDAWKYANDSFRRMFLLKIQQDLGYDRKPLMQSFYTNKSEDVEINTDFSTPKLIIGLFIALLLVLAIIILPINSDYKILGSTVVAICTLYYNILKGAVQEFRVNVQKPHMFAPEQFETCFNDMCDRALGNKQSRISDYIKGERGVSGLHRLIIVIDNVDRCTSEIAYELFTNIKNFLGQKHNIIFIIPVDEDSLKKHLIVSNSDVNHESDEFLRKFFNICIRIKPFHQEEMFDFAEQMNVKYGVGLNSNTLGLISQEFASNPRRIIQIINNLIAEFKNIPSQFVERDESLICKLLIIREEYPDFYRALAKDATLLFSEDAQKDYTDKNDLLKRFLYRTNSISYNYKDQIEIVESILSNSVVFDQIPQKVLDEISSDDIKETKAYIANPSNKDKLLNYVLQKIQININRNTYKTGVNLHMNYLMRICKDFNFKRGDFARIADTVKDLSIPDYLKGEVSIRAIVEFAQKMANEKQSVLNDMIKELLCDEMNLNNISNDMLIDGTFYGYTIWKGEMLIDLKERLYKSFGEKPEEIFKFDFGTNKEIVFDDDIIGKIIEAQFKDNQPVEKETNLFIKLINTITINGKNLAKAIEKISEKVENFKNSEVGKEQVERYTNYLTQILATFPKDYVLKDSSSLETIAKKVCHTYVEVISYNSNVTRAYYTSGLDQEKQKQFVDFCFQSLRITKKTIIPEAYLKIMLSLPESTSYLLGKLNELLSYDYPVSKYSKEIFSITTITYELLQLYSYLFVVHEADSSTYVISDDVVSQKLKPVLLLLFESDSDLKTDCENLLLSLFDDVRCANVLIGIISSDTTEHIQKLPQSIHKKIIPVFNEHFDDYSDKMQIMHVMASSPNSDIQSKVVRKIVNMLTTSGKEKDAFSLIKEIKTRDKRLVAMLVSTLEGMTISDSLKEERDECLSIFQIKMEKKDNSKE